VAAENPYTLHEGENRQYFGSSLWACDDLVAVM
jgi:hypothetical protein